MGHETSYLNVAKILRQQASIRGSSPERVVRAIKLAEYFERLAADPCADIPMAQRA
jgi:hypothetical protein